MRLGIVPVQLFVAAPYLVAILEEARRPRTAQQLAALLNAGADEPIALEALREQVARCPAARGGRVSLVAYAAWLALQIAERQRR